VARGEEADLARAVGVRAAAGAEVEALDLDDAQLARARRVLAEREARGLLGRQSVDADGAVLPDDFVGALDGALDALVRRVGQFDIYFRGVGRHAEAAGLRAEQLDESLRENVLPGVLLHVVEAARPIDAAAHLGPFGRGVALYDVEHALRLSVDALDDAGAAERAGVRRLPAAGRVEGRAVERDGRAAVVRARQGQDARVELGQVRVVVVEPFGHRSKDVRGMMIKKALSFRSSFIIPHASSVVKRRF
jgi:hypothetical protein